MAESWDGPLHLADWNEDAFHRRSKDAVIGPASAGPATINGVRFSKKWCRLILPRHGSASADFEIPDLDPTSVPLYLEAVAREHRSFFEQLIAESPDYAGDLPAFQRGPTVLEDPTTAALWWRLSHWTISQDHWAPLIEPLIDWWVAERGHRFAVQAVHAMLTCWRFQSRADRPGDKLSAETGLASASIASDCWGKIEVRRSWVWMRGYGMSPEAACVHRLRRHLSKATASEHEAAESCSTNLTTTHEFWTPLAAFLFPSAGLVDDLLAGGRPHAAIWVASAITTLDELERYSALETYRADWLGARGPGDLLPTLLETFGADLTPWLKERIIYELESDAGKVTNAADMVTALTMIGDDQAVTALAELSDKKYAAMALQKYADKHPVQVARVLAGILAAKQTHDGEVPRGLFGLLQRIVGTDAGARSEVVAFPTIAAQLADGSADGQEAEVETLPALLVNPPWKGRKTQERRIVEGVAVIEIEPEVSWIDGGLPVTAPIPQRTHTPLPPDQLDALREDCERPRWSNSSYFLYPPIDELRAWLDAHWSPEGLVAYRATWTARILLERLELEALPYVRDLLRCHPNEMRNLMECFGLVDRAAGYADQFHRLKSQRRRAGGWLTRFPRHAIYGLIPDAVGSDKKARDAAGAALRMLAEREPALVAQISAEYGNEVAEIVAEELAISPMELLPSRMPKLPDFLLVEAMALPQVADGSGALTVEAAQNLLMMMAISTADDPYPGVELVLTNLDRASTLAFMWEAFVIWQDAGFPAKHSWILLGVGMVGDDGAVRQLAPLVRKWPHEGGAKRAQVGIDALGAMGSSLAMMELFTLSRKAKTSGLRRHASMRVQNIADRLGLSEDALQDRLIPDLGLDENGTRTFDFGERTFTVGFDESLVPFVRDADGKSYKSLPRKTKTDDEDKVKAAKSEFTAIKKEAKAVAADQLRRFEVAMTTGRRWTYGDFREFFADHPLMRHLARRLVWGVYDGSLIASFRLAEDGTLADVDDDEVTLRADVSVGVAHPANFAADVRSAWGEVLSDYELLQPFDQMSRPVYELSDAEQSETSLERYAGREASAGRFLGLRGRGWKLSPYGGFTRRALTTDGREVFVHLAVGGIHMDYLDPHAKETLQEVWVDTSEGRTSPNRENSLPLGELDAIAASELLLDLEHLFR